ncbi:hypothetical protein HMPREF9946_01737 [Acetobacteraceae bacterium AT-5844]|nr:hypothetical protein HMPREF9946_01737 [Acetobacteraceae bacterium AT-5844]
MTATYFRLRDGSFRQDWSAIGQISVNDDWAGVASIEGFGEPMEASGLRGGP